MTKLATKHLCLSDKLVVLLLTAVFSMTIAHLTDLGTEILGSAPVSTFAVTGNLAGLAACVGSGWLGYRRLHR